MIRRQFALAAAVIAGAAVALPAQKPFEGAITMNVTSHDASDGPTQIIYMMKGGKIRFEAQPKGGPAVASVIDPAAKQMLMIVPAQKMYMTMDYGQMMGDQPEGKADHSKVTKTGKTETIAGYKCEHWLVTDSDGEQSDACIASGIGTFFTMGGGPGRHSPPPAWATELRKAGGFPLKVTDADGKVVMLVTNIDKKPLDASLFEAPAGYRNMQMGGMGGRPPER